MVEWTVEMKDDLKRWYEEGTSDHEIAGKMSLKYYQFITRNAVIGARHRNKWYQPKPVLPPAIEKKKRTRKKRPPRTKTVQPVHAVAHNIERIKGQRTAPAIEFALNQPTFVCDAPISLMQLTKWTCKWPLDEGDYCGKTVFNGYSYCAFHHAISVRR